VVMKR